MSMPARNDRFMKWFDRRYALQLLVDRLRDRIAEVETVAARLEVLSAEQQLRIASVTVPALVLGGTNTQTVSWSRAMPSASYNTYVGYETLLGAGKAEVTGQTVSTVTVKTTASGVISAGTRVLVIAWTDN